MSLLEGLNEQQLQAVTSDNPIILNLAGAGSGKTRVLTHRMAYLHQEKRVGTSNMLALTFTRLAAKEMKERVMDLIGMAEGYKLTVGTFHSFCVQVLREFGYLVGMEPNFTIYDEEDRTAIIRACIDELGYKKVKVQDVLDNLYKDLTNWDQSLVRVLEEYEYRLKRNNAVDLDALLFFTRDILESSQAQRELQNRYRYIFVDEFQDTNDIQFEIIQLLNPENLFVVGDDFQSIYGWRGSNVRNIIEFPDKNPGCEVIKLERNYRSTKQIVSAANTLIKHNLSQTEKALIADRDGLDIRYLIMPDEDAEARSVATNVGVERVMNAWSDIAVLARTNRQLQKIKEVLDRRDIPSLIVSSQDDVFKKNDIRNLISLIEVALNPQDEINLRKVINFPCPRVTDLEMSHLELASIMGNNGYVEEMKNSQIPGGLEFLELLQTIRDITEEFDSAAVILANTFIVSGIFKFYKENGLTNRFDDNDSMLEKVEQWQEIQDSLGESRGIHSFLKWIKTRDLQEKLVQEKVDAVKLMTVHASKGLEFPVVFVIGMNQNVFPSKRTEDSEEERRLFYVAITRAKDRLYLTRPEQRVAYPGGPMALQMESQFIREIELELAEMIRLPQGKAVEFGWL